jgi:D-glycero-alpha-D-manno-heptose-7-phosphate kinase
MILSRAPYRVSIVGGGTDFPEFFNEHGGAVVSFAIDKYIHCCVTPRFENDWRVSYTQLEIKKSIEEIEHTIVRETLLKCYRNDIPLEIVTVGDIPGKSGLGSSSATANALVKALRPDLGAGQVADLSCNIEIDRCGSPIGVQDQYASAYGGMNLLVFNSNGVSVLPVTADVHEQITNKLMAVYTGEISDSAKVLPPMKRNMSDRKRQLCRMRDIAHELFDEIQSGNYDAVGEALKENWDLKKQLASCITSSTIDDLYGACLSNGAYSGKILGSGGGGFLLLWCSNALDKAKLADWLVSWGFPVMNLRVDTAGATIVYNNGVTLP